MAPDDRIQDILEKIRAAFPEFKTKDPNLGDEVLRSLPRILTSSAFAKHDKEQEFLTAVVLFKALGAVESCNGPVLSHLLFGQPNQNMGTYAKRTRDDLEEYYRSEGASKPTRIRIEHRHYAAIPEPAPQQAAVTGYEFNQAVASRWIQENPDVGSRFGITRYTDIFGPTVPAREVRGWLAGPALCICSVVKTDLGKVLLLPSNHSSSRREGLGRSSILLSMLGLNLPYARLMNLHIDDLASAISVRLSYPSQLHSPLIAADRAYLAITEQGLAAIPMRGEPIDFVWDIARHLFRSTRVDYFRGMHRDTEHRPELLSLMFQLKLDINIFAKYAPDWDGPHFIDHVVVMEVNQFSRNPEMKLIQMPRTGWNQEIVNCLEFTTSHESAFWRERRPEAEEFLAAFDQHFRRPEKHVPVDGLKKLLVAHESDLFSHELFGDAATLLLRDQEKLPDPAVGYIRGLSAYNNRVIRALLGGDPVSIVALSGAKLLGDRDFWKAVQKAAQREVRVEILLLDPGAKDTIQRFAAAYHGLGADFLEDEIRHSIGLVKRLRLSSKELEHCISLELYNRMPEFKLAKLGSDTFIVGSYSREKRSGALSSFQTITKGDALFEGFAAHLESIWLSTWQGAAVYLASELGNDRKWESLVIAIAERIRSNSESALYLSDIDEVSASVPCTADETLAVLGMLSRPAKGLLEMQLRNDADDKSVVSIEDFISQLRKWRKSTLADEKWSAWATKILVRWVRDHANEPQVETRGKEVYS